MTQRDDFVCPSCGYTFAGAQNVGRPRVYCSPACRQEAYRRRRWDHHVNWMKGNSCANYWE